jgi:hypothetical protein
MSKPTIKFDEWMAQRDALMSQGKFDEALSLALKYTVLGTNGQPLNPNAELSDELETATSRPSKSARQSEYDDLFWQAQLAGKDAKEAARLAANELARRHGEPGHVVTQADAEADLEANRDAYSAYLLGRDGTESDEPLTIEAMAESIRAMNDENQPIGVDMDNVSANVRKREAADAHERQVNDLYRTMKASNPDMDDALVRQMAETAAGPVKAAAPKSTGAEGLADTPELREALGMPQKAA